MDDTNAQPAQPPALEIPLQPVESSNLEAIGYDPASRTLAVKFKNGTLYHYADVPASVWEGLQGASSAGRFYSAMIRGTFTGTKQP